MVLTSEQAGRLMAIALGHVEREYPSKLDHVLTGPDDLCSPRDLHPVFYGSFDWHSCVHSYWLLARLSHRFPSLPEAAEARRLFSTAFVADNVAGELAYLERPASKGFERPYGWAWLLKLAAEHETLDAAGPWASALRPLAKAFSARFQAFLSKVTYPVRTGVHSSSAFSFVLALDYAQACGDEGLARAVAATARQWFAGDADCQAWEPGGEDFLSPCLVEAECMRRILDPASFASWFGRFLPRIDRREPRTLFEPAVVADRSDGRLAHLDGLNLSRAWCWANLAQALPPADPRRSIMQDAAAAHLEAGLPHVAGDYMGEHWLATFALLALDAGG